MKVPFIFLSLVDPSNARLVTFELDFDEPCLPYAVSFEVLVTIKNLTIHQCIINERSSTYFMSTITRKS